MKLFNKSNYSMDSKAYVNLRNAVIYIALFVVWLFAGIFSGDEILIFVGGFLMSLITIAVCVILPNDRGATLKAFKGNVAGYSLYIIVLQLMMLASNNASFLAGLFSVSKFLYPLGYVVWQGKKFMYLLGIGKTRKESIDYYKEHGNDGNM